MISVVIATYNGEKYIKKQLLSIINQSRIPDEIIISDDNSKDETINIVNRIVQKYKNEIKFVVIKNKINLGYIDNFINAINFATGRIVFLADQDDIWYKNKIELVSRYFIQNSNIIVLGTAYDLIDVNDKIIKAHCKYKTKKEILKNISWENFIRSPRMPGMSMAISSEWFGKNKHIFTNEVAHDWQIAELAAGMNGLFYLNKPLVQYRQHESNVSGGVINFENMIEKNYKNIDSLLKKCKVAKYIFKNDEKKMTFLKAYEKSLVCRLNAVSCGNVFILIRNFVKNSKYYSIRNFTGDVLCIVKEKLNQRYKYEYK